MIFRDDILIYSRAPLEYEENLRIMPSILREKKLFAKFNKCKFWMSEFKFLGHVISQGGVAVDPSKVEVVINWEPLKNASKVRSFLGLVGCYQKLIMVFSQLALHLARIARKDILLS